MKLETNRLEVVLLTPAQSSLFIKNISKLEKELNCLYKAEPLEGVLLKIAKAQAEIAQNDPQNNIWHSFWFLIRKSDRTVVGTADYKNMPNDNGEVEIGYGLGKEHEHNGYMTEAVTAMCEFALKQNGVTSIIAETEFDNPASQRILERCGFKKYKQDKSIWWRLQNHDIQL